MATEMRCSKCGQVKPVTDFDKHLKAKDGLRPWCKVCSLKYLKQRKRPLRAAWVEDD
jgi:phage FluMu protein Com